MRWQSVRHAMPSQRRPLFTIIKDSRLILAAVEIFVLMYTLPHTAFCLLAVFVGLVCRPPPRCVLCLFLRLIVIFCDGAGSSETIVASHSNSKVPLYGVAKGAHFLLNTRCFGETCAVPCASWYTTTVINSRTLVLSVFLLFFQDAYGTINRYNVLYYLLYHTIILYYCTVSYHATPEHLLLIP